MIYEEQLWMLSRPNLVSGESFRLHRAKMEGRKPAGRRMLDKLTFCRAHLNRQLSCSHNKMTDNGNLRNKKVYFGSESEVTHLLAEKA